MVLAAVAFETGSVVFLGKELKSFVAVGFEKGSQWLQTLGMSRISVLQAGSTSPAHHVSSVPFKITLKVQPRGSVHSQVS